MKYINYIYYCAYRVVLKTRPDVAHVWAIIFLPSSVSMHSAAIHLILTKVFDVSKTEAHQWKVAGLIVYAIMITMSFWYYCINNNGRKVVARFGYLENTSKPAWIGFIMFLEMLLLPLLVAVSIKIVHIFAYLLRIK